MFFDNFFPHRNLNICEKTICFFFRNISIKCIILASIPCSGDELNQIHSYCLVWKFTCVFQQMPCGVIEKLFFFPNSHIWTKKDPFFYLFFTFSFYEWKMLSVRLCVLIEHVLNIEISSVQVWKVSLKLNFPIIIYGR